MVVPPRATVSRNGADKAKELGCRGLTPAQGAPLGWSDRDTKLDICLWLVKPSIAKIANKSLAVTENGQVCDDCKRFYSKSLGSDIIIFFCVRNVGTFERLRYGLFYLHSS